MSDPSTTTAAVIVVNYGSSALLAANGALRNRPGTIVVVVDNLTTTDERRRVDELAAERQWVTVPMSSNVGFGAGMNAGVDRARKLGADAFLLLNPDASISDEASDALIDVVRRGPMTLAAPRILRPDGSTWFEGASLRLEDGRTSGPAEDSDVVESWLTGACLAVHEKLWSRVGGFADGYFLYWEDVDLSRKVRKAGGTLRVVDSVTAIHDEGGTHTDARRGRGKSDTYYYYNIRNRLLFAATNLSTKQVRRWRRRTIPVSWGILLEGGRRQLLTSTRPLRAAVRGIVDGDRYARSALKAAKRSAR